LGTSGIERWLGDAWTEAWMDRKYGDRVRYPAALPAAVALTNRIAMHTSAAADYFPHPPGGVRAPRGPRMPNRHRCSVG